MPLNLIKKYNDLLDINHLNERDRLVSLKNIFERDIVDNLSFKFRQKLIRPITKEDGLPAIETLFKHLTHKSEDKVDENGKKYKSRNVFDIKRSERLHWVLHHLKEKEEIKIFSVNDRVKGKGDVLRTYLFDENENYVIILEPFRTTNDYYLLSAYYLEKEYGGIKTIQKKYKRRLDEIY